jgi:PTS system mannose-specific IID component
MRLPIGLRVLVFLRSFLLQSVWNPQGMQHIGFCFAMLPVARGMDERERREFAERHLEFFNSNPVLASYVLGASAATELASENGECIEVLHLKRSLAGPLGMAGDALFWGSLRPLAGLAAVLAAIGGRLWAPLLFLALYNVPHLMLRWRGIGRGGELGPGAAREVLGAGFRGAIRRLRLSLAFLAGLTATAAVGLGQGPTPPRAVVALVFLVAGFLAARMHVPASLLGAAGVLCGLILSLTGTIGG